ncbi:hypothetical protein F5141DRAFT_1206582, partial [Pisolithus sp. B1]
MAKCPTSTSWVVGTLSIIQFLPPLFIDNSLLHGTPVGTHYRFRVAYPSGQTYWRVYPTVGPVTAFGMNDACVYGDFLLRGDHGTLKYPDLSQGRRQCEITSKTQLHNAPTWYNWPSGEDTVRNLHAPVMKGDLTVDISTHVAPPLCPSMVFSPQYRCQLHTLNLTVGLQTRYVTDEDTQVNRGDQVLLRIRVERKGSGKPPSAMQTHGDTALTMQCKGKVEAERTRE